MTKKLNLTVRLSLLTLSLFFAGFASAQDVIPTKGKEFWVGFMENYEVEEWQESLDLFIVSDQNTTGTVSIPLQGWSQDFAVVANVTTTVSIPNDIAEHFTFQVVEDKGIYVETQDTVAVFAINFNGYTADGTKILPTQSLGIEYRIPSYFGLSGWGSEFLIVATEDDSEIEITTTAATTGGNAAGVPFTINLDQGESYQVMADGAGGDLTGTVIKGTEANGTCRPFAVYSGVSCTNVPVGCFACDHIYEQNFPVDTWGTDYYVVPFSFATSYTYRVMANVDNTNVQIDGAPAGVLNAGEYLEYNDVSTVACVTADQPISTIQYMEGVGCANAGDPAMLILNDRTQKIDNITFSTVSSTVINEHGLNIVMETADVGTLTLDGGAVDAALFTPFPSCPDHSYAQITITEGSHTLDATPGFTAYVYGTGSAESYAYSVGSFSPLPPINIDTVLCTSDTVNIGLDGSYWNPYWYALSNPEDTIGFGSQLTLYPPIISDIYVGVGNQFVSGCTEEEYFSVEVPTPPELTLSQSATEICQYQSVQLNVDVDPPSDVYVYEWTPINGLDNPNIANPIATPLETTEYSVTVSTPTGCGTNTAGPLTIEVTDGNISGLTAETDEDLICAGEEANFLADLEEVTFEDNMDPGVSWGLWCEVLNGSESTDCGSVSGNAMYFNGAGDRFASTEPLDLTAGGSIQFALKIATGAFPCDNADPGENVVLEYSTTEIGLYFEASYPVFTDIAVDIPAGAMTAATNLRWRQLANSGDGQDNWALDNVYIGVINNAAYDFTWSPDYNISDVTAADPTVNPEIDTMYYVEVYDDVSGCTYLDSILIDVGQPFDLEITPDTSLCDLAGIDLEVIPSGTDDYNFTWSPDDGTVAGLYTADPTVSPIATTTYTVDVVSDQGCENSAQVTITVNQLLDLLVDTDNNDFCAGEIANLTADVPGAPVGLTYEWSPADYLDDPSIPNPVSTPTESVTYEILVTDTASGCVLTDELTIDVFAAFEVSTFQDSALCEVNGLQLDASTTSINFVNWEWEPALSVSDPLIPNPTVTVNATDQFIVTATDAAGCSASDTLNVELLFEYFDLGADVDICIGANAILETGYGAEYEHLWSTDETSTTISVTTSDTYSVTVTSPQGCEDTAEVEVMVHDLPEIDLGLNQDLCDGDTYNISAGNFGSDYLWSTTEVTETITVDETDTYTVTVTDIFDCENSEDVYIEFHANPVINLLDSAAFCEDESITLDAENPGSTYEWTNGFETQTVTINETGLIGVTVTNVWGCTSEDESLISVATYPVVDLGEDLAFCEGEMFTLDAGNPGLNYNWSTGEDGQTIDIFETDIYEVTVDNGYCFTSDIVSLVFNPLPNKPLSGDSTVCFSWPPYHVVLNAGNPGHTYSWNTGSTAETILADGAGLYVVQITSPFGCVITDSTYIDEQCYGDDLFIPNSFSPNSDGINDALFAYGRNVVEFRMDIWDRWGELIFTNEDIYQPWVGDMNGGDYYVESEVYVYVVTYRYILDVYGTVSDPVQKTGHITLIR
jgi:gliding motility-associated-like protein